MGDLATMAGAKSEPRKDDPNARIYPCKRCGKMRSKNEGGTTFTVCDECWDKSATVR